MRGPFPFAPLQPGIQLQAQRRWGLSEDLAKVEEEGAPGQYFVPPSSYQAMHKFSCQPPALRPGPLQWGGLCRPLLWGQLRAGVEDRDRWLLALQ